VTSFGEEVGTRVDVPLGYPEHAHRVGLEQALLRSADGGTRFCFPGALARSPWFPLAIPPHHFCSRSAFAAGASPDDAFSPKFSQQMFLGRGSGGPKQWAWQEEGAKRFESFFVRNSERDSEPELRAEQPPPWKEASMGQAEVLRWIFVGIGGEESQPMHARVGQRVVNVVSGVAGALVCKGVGTVSGDGTCMEFWALNGLEVAAGTVGASRLLHGGAGDLQLRLSDGATVWCGEHHVSLIDDTDALAVGGERADLTANDASNTAAEVSDASGLEQADVNMPIASDDELSDASHASRDSSEGVRARAEQQQEIDEKRAKRLAATAWAADPQRLHRPRGSCSSPTCADMRQEMQGLGYAAEAKAARNKKDLCQALSAARAGNPRTAQANPDGDDGDGDEDEDDDEAMEGETYAVDDVVRTRTKPGRGREFLVRWKGFSRAHDTWEPEVNLPTSIVREFFEMAGDNDDDDDDDDDEDEDNDDERAAATATTSPTKAAATTATKAVKAAAAKAAKATAAKASDAAAAEAAAQVEAEAAAASAARAARLAQRSGGAPDPKRQARCQTAGPSQVAPAPAPTVVLTKAPTQPQEEGARPAPQIARKPTPRKPAAPKPAAPKPAAPKRAASSADGPSKRRRNT
jgi:hypothetical protein